MNIFKKHFVWIICSTVIMIVLGFLWHFLYQLLGKPQYLAWLFPVNESVFEHLKMTLWPILIVWLIIRYCFSVPYHPDIHKSVLCIWASTWIAEFIILSIHYILLAGFDLEHVAIDIIAYMIGIFVGQLFVTMHVLPFKAPTWVYCIGYIGLLLSIIGMGIFSYLPPDCPIFVDPEA